jgi:hypothetical protein
VGRPSKLLQKSESCSVRWDVGVWFSVDAFRRMLAEIQREVAS